MRVMTGEAADTHRLLKGASVLIVEDDHLLAEALQVSLQHAGCVALEPADSVAGAFKAMERCEVDVALLDVRLHGELVFPLADALASRGVPFVFVTSHPRRDIPQQHRFRPFISKPFRDADLLGGLKQALVG